MATKNQFLGFKKILSTAKSSMVDNYLYFVRDNGSAVEGELWFNGTCYGKCRDVEIDDIKRTLADFLSGGTASGTTVKDYIDEAVSAITSGMTTSVELDPDAFSGLTIEDKSATPNVKDYVINLQNVAREDLLEKEIQDREDADEALEDKLEATAQTLSDAIEAEERARESADDDLQDQIDELSGATDDLQAEVDRIETAVGLNADGTYVADDGQYVSAATSVLDATAKLNDALVQEVVDRNQAIEDAIEALIGDASESGNTLGELEDRIEELSADAKEYHLVKVTTGLSAEIKEEYYLADAEGNQSGDTISVPKDSHIVEINYITDSGDPHYQNLEYVYIDVCGATKTEYVDMSQLILEQEFASGITSTDGVAHGVVDPASEDFLTVGADGFKLSGVQDAIDDAVEAEADERKDADDAIESALTLTAQTLVEMIENAASAATTEVVEGTDAGNNLSIDESAGADGHKIYTINLADVASASALTQEISDREAADAAIQAELDAVESSLGFTDTAYTNSGTYISGETVTGDINLLDTALGDLNNNMADLADALEATAQTLSDDIKEEASARTAADEALEEKLAETAATLTDMIEDEASARTATDNALDERLDAVEESYLTGLTVNGVEASVSANTADVTIQADDIELGEEVTGTTGGIHFDATANTQDVFQSIVDVLNQSVAGSYTGVTSTGNTISVTPATNGNNIEFLKETATDATVADGHLELAKNGSNEWYGVMYWIDEETD